MNRVKEACICQTLHFMMKEDAEPGRAVSLVRQEVEQYKNTLEANRTLYKILEEPELPDGSIMLKIVKQYNSSPIGNYLD